MRPSPSPSPGPLREVCRPRRRTDNVCFGPEAVTRLKMSEQEELKLAADLPDPRVAFGEAGHEVSIPLAAHPVFGHAPACLPTLSAGNQFRPGWRPSSGDSR